MDWLSEPDGMLSRLDRLLGRIARCHPARGWLLMSTQVAVRRRHALRRVRRGVAAISQGRRVLTDRLHVHILCVLLGIPHWLFNSLDGKVFALHEAWTAGNGFTTLLDDPADLSDVALRLPVETPR